MTARKGGVDNTSGNWTQGHLQWFIMPFAGPATPLYMSKYNTPIINHHIMFENMTKYYWEKKIIGHIDLHVVFKRILYCVFNQECVTWTIGYSIPCHSTY